MRFIATMSKSAVVLFATLALAPFASQAQEAVPLVLPDEAAAIRQSLNNGWSAESAGSKRSGDAWKSYRKAALYGSNEGYYRAGKVLLSRGKEQANNGVCLLQVASQLGHRKATETLSSLSARKGEAAVKCNDATMRMTQES